MPDRTTGEEREYRHKRTLVKAAQAWQRRLISAAAAGMENDATVDPGDWIVTRGDGTQYAVPRTVFEKEFEPEGATRELSNVTPEDAVASGWHLTEGPAQWETVCKGWHAEAGLMKSTKRLAVPGGWLYQVTTEGPLGYAEAITFVPGPAKNERNSATKPQKGAI